MPYVTPEELKQLFSSSPYPFQRTDIPLKSTWQRLTPGQKADYHTNCFGYAYIFDAHNGNYKIGCTQDLYRRRIEICSRYECDGKYLIAFQSPNMWAIEKLFHDFFNDNHVSGEWFRFTAQEIDWIQAVKPPAHSRIIGYTAHELENLEKWDLYL